jgi:signal transduction histidine kinase
MLSSQVHAIRSLQRVDGATIVLDRQRLRVAESVYMPLNRTAIRARSADFQNYLANPDLFFRPESIRLQQEILTQQQDFTRAALALPPSPTVAQVQSVDAQAQEVIGLLDTLRELHIADLNTIITSQQRQTAVTILVLIINNLAVLMLMFVGFVLLSRLGQQQAEAAALRATDQLRNEFIAFAAHELRNPASAIKTGASLLREPDLDAETRRDIVDSISRSADALSRLVLNLLTMGRLEEGRLHLMRRVVWLAELVDELVTEMELYHPGLEKRIERTLPAAQVSVDPDYLKLAISNIIDNAIKFSPRRSPIIIMGEREGRIVVVHIQDRGPGIPPDILPHIFEKYETTGAAASSAKRGVGLGLYMTRLLIEVHGGRIWAESVPGQGTTISFILPIVD